MAKAKRYKVIEVHWVDAVSADDGKEDDYPVPVVSVGILKSRTKKAVTLSLGRSHDPDDWGPRIIIPSGMVVSEHDLGFVEP